MTADQRFLRNLIVVSKAMLCVRRGAPGEAQLSLSARLADALSEIYGRYG